MKKRDLGISRLWLYKVNRQFYRKPFNVVAGGFVIFVCLLGLFADLIASENPIACKVDGQVHILPAIFSTAELVDYDNQSLLDKIARDGGWTLAPPIPFGPNQTKVDGAIDWLAAPSDLHVLGTDGSGRDVLARIIHGARSAMLVGLSSMLLCTILGVLLGALAAYFGGFWDRVANVGIETLTAFPTLFLILGIQGLLGISSIWQLVVIIGATRWTDVARVTRAEVLRTVNEEYVEAARALGLSHVRILRRHVLPAVLGPVLVSATFGIASAILIESTLSFLGYGAPPPTASWGGLLADAFASQRCYWLILFPGVALSATVLAINIAGEGLSDAVDVL
ncbi:MAG: ABC transporter permease [Deltaproteobacteria bacterium]|nr:ABC transporter permease [Deltaproteobacteria bacterium]MBN2670223.1 ABC transporter permease [Deltaproteobacteria bacterium]